MFKSSCPYVYMKNISKKLIDIGSACNKTVRSLSQILSIPRAYVPKNGSEPSASRAFETSNWQDRKPFCILYDSPRVLVMMSTRTKCSACPMGKKVVSGKAVVRECLSFRIAEVSRILKSVLRLLFVLKIASMVMGRMTG